MPRAAIVGRSEQNAGVRPDWMAIQSAAGSVPQVLCPAMADDMAGWAAFIASTVIPDNDMLMSHYEVDYFAKSTHLAHRD